MSQDRSLAHTLADLEAWQRLSPLLTEYLPTGGHGIRPAALVALLDAILLDDRTVLLQCGCGPATVVIARLLARRGFGRLLALEHDGRWAAFISSQLRREGLVDAARVVHAPLAAHPDAPDGTLWYQPERVYAEVIAYVERYGLADWLLIDGPSAATAAAPSAGPSGAAAEPPADAARPPADAAMGSLVPPGAAMAPMAPQQPGQHVSAGPSAGRYGAAAGVTADAAGPPAAAAGPSADAAMGSLVPPGAAMEPMARQKPGEHAAGGAAAAASAGAAVASAKYPAVPVLRGALAPGATVFAHGVEGAAEQAVLRRWAAEDGMTFAADPITHLAHAVLAP